MARMTAEQYNRLARSEEYNSTQEVCTVAEVVRLWGKDDATVNNDINSDKLAARKTSSGMWILSLASVLRLYGHPPGFEGKSAQYALFSVAKE